VDEVPELLVDGPWERVQPSQLLTERNELTPTADEPEGANHLSDVIDLGTAEGCRGRPPTRRLKRYIARELYPLIVGTLVDLQPAT
jgi:hypothetical protein